MTTTEVFLAQIEYNEIPGVGWFPTFHFLPRIMQDGVEFSRGNKPHSVTLMPDADITATFSAINQDITTRDGLKWPAIVQSDIDRVTSHVNADITPEIKAAYEQLKAAQLKL